MVLTTTLLIASSANAATQQTPCDMPEVVAGQAEYNQLICSGMASLRSGHLDQAELSFGKADLIVFHESPNFRVLHLLAAVAARRGHLAERGVWLARSRMSLEVWTGIKRCSEDSQTGLTEMSGADALGPESEWVADRMCGAIYDSLYEGRRLEDVMGEARLVQRYLEVATNSFKP